MITILDNAVPPKILANVFTEIKEFGYFYGWKSNSDTDPHGHWNYKIIHASKKETKDQRHTLNKEKYPACCAWLDWLTKEVVGENSLLRFYVNAHTYGIDGYPHCDTTRDREEKTFLMYLSPDWLPEYAGETVIFNEIGNDIEKSIIPKFGRIIGFPSNRLHAARSVSRLCNKLRITLVCKLGPKENG